MKYLKLFESEEDKFDVESEIDSKYNIVFVEKLQKGNFDALLDAFEGAEDNILEVIRDVEDELVQDITSYVNGHPYVWTYDIEDWGETVQRFVEKAGIYKSAEEKFNNELNDNEEWIKSTLREAIEDEPNLYMKLQEFLEETSLFGNIGYLIKEILGEYEELGRSAKSGLWGLNKR